MADETGRTRALLEAGAVAAGAGLNFLGESIPHAKGPLVGLMVGAWLAYLAGRVRRDPGLWREWGFRADNLLPALGEASLLGAAALAAIVPYGLHRGHFPPPASFWAVILLYPLWGLAQQFLLQALLARNLRPFLGAAVVPAAAALFSIAHAPDWPLMGLTFAAGLAWTWLYQRRPNLWVLGAWHGVLGAAAWYGVLGRDAWRALGG
jgi:membrane protease YdiL (CAAX protease family)